VCNPAPLKPLVSYCSSVLEFVESLQDKGNVKVASQKHHNVHAKADSSDTNSCASDISPSAFCGSNVKELVKLLKSATEPLHELIAEAEEELSKDSQLADSSRTQKKHDTLASNLKTQYVKCVRALSGVNRTKPQTEEKNCTVDSSLPVVSVERLDQSLTEQTNSESKKAEDTSSSRTADSIHYSSRASRADIEAQRDLHQQMLSSKDASAEDGSTSSESSTSSSEDAEGSSSEESGDDDEYDPKKEIRQVKLERVHERRTTMKKQKMRAGN